MIRTLCAIALALAAARSAEAMTFGPLSPPNDMIAKVVSTCGAVHTSGRHGACETRHIRRCVRHRHSGVCLRYQ
jgi:hypothetical protein